MENDRRTQPTQLVEYARRSDLDRDFNDFRNHRAFDFGQAIQGLRDRYQRIGILGEGRDLIRLTSESINEEYIKILQSMREGSNVTLAILKTLNRLNRKPSSTLMGRLDQATDLSQDILNATNHKTNIFGKPLPDESIRVVSDLGIYAPYIPTLERIVDSKSSTKRLLKNIASETEKTEANIAKTNGFIEKKGKRIRNNANAYDTSLQGRNDFDVSRQKIISTQQDIIQAVLERTPISSKIQTLSDQIVNSTAYTKGALASDEKLKYVLEDIAVLGSLQSEQAALVAVHRASVVSMGAEMIVHTQLPFQMAEVISRETERLQLLNLHILLQIQKEILGDVHPENLRGGVGRKILNPTDLKDTMINRIQMEAKQV